MSVWCRRTGKSKYLSLDLGPARTGDVLRATVRPQSTPQRRQRQLPLVFQCNTLSWMDFSTPGPTNASEPPLEPVGRSACYPRARRAPSPIPILFRVGPSHPQALPKGLGSTHLAFLSFLYSSCATRAPSTPATIALFRFLRTDSPSP